MTQGIVLAGVSLFAGLTACGWAVGLGLAGAMNLLVARSLPRTTMGSANRVTWFRATLACAVAALVADSLIRARPATAVFVLAAVALALDNIDGRVARRTGESSSFGARFDMEVDAFLILVLSVDVARMLGAWVLAIGAMRYALWAAELLLPWLREPVPARYWRKVVAAVQGVVLVVAASGVLPAVIATAVVLSALALLVESFGRDVWWLSRGNSEIKSRARGAVRPVAEWSTS